MSIALHVFHAAICPHGSKADGADGSAHPIAGTRHTWRDYKKLATEEVQWYNTIVNVIKKLDVHYTSAHAYINQLQEVFRDDSELQVSRLQCIPSV